MSKIRTGTEEYSKIIEDFSHEDVDQVKVVPLSVDWRYEESEYGDGSRDEEFEILSATDSDGQEYELTQSEQDELEEKLRDRGEFA